MLNPIRSSAQFVYSSSVSAIRFLDRHISPTINKYIAPTVNKYITPTISKIFKAVKATILSPFSKYEKDKTITLDGKTITIRELKPKHRKIEFEETSTKVSNLSFIYNLFNIHSRKSN